MYKYYHYNVLLFIYIDIHIYNKKDYCGTCTWPLGSGQTCTSVGRVAGQSEVDLANETSCRNLFVLRLLVRGQLQLCEHELRALWGSVIEIEAKYTVGVLPFPTVLLGRFSVDLADQKGRRKV